MNYRPFCITVMVTESDANEVRLLLQNYHLPKRVHLILYITNPKKNADCVVRLDRRKRMFCHQEKVYALNRLRNIAIENVQTSHFIVFDMDMWPASKNFIHSFDHSFDYLFNQSIIHSFDYSFILSFIRSFDYLFIHSINHSIIYSFIRLFVHSFVHSFIHLKKLIL